MFTVGLEKRFGGRGIHAYAVHPGGIQTNLGRHLSDEQSSNLIERIKKSDPGYEWKTIPQGAATQCWAATAPELEGTGGVYCEDCHVAEVDDESSGGGVRSYALEEGAAERLWTMSEEMTGERFG
jgi:NAD(P)-dependent dehydrogenase (short-subunit alcohol dehydrogenase family)